MKYAPYEGYAKPDVPWLGGLPSHWKVRRTKTMFALQKSKVGRSASDYALLSLTLGGVIPRNMADGGKLPAEFDTYQVVEPDDLVFCLFDIDETPRTIGISRDHGMITGAYSVYRALPSCVPEYACYYFLHIDSFKGLRPFYTGLRKVVRADTFSKVDIPCPPLSEQAQIARFLDYETAKIDRLIEKQQQLIALLKDKRQAVISHAVTKGLNPDAPMKDSGVEWLGEVPAHWTASQLKRTWASSDYGISESTSSVGAYEVLTMGDIQDGEILTPGVRFVSTIDSSLLLKPGDLLFNRTNSLALVGKVGLFHGGEGITFASYCVRIRVTAKHDPEYFNYLLNSDYVLASARATSFPSISQTNLNPTRYGGLPVSYPSLDEQKRIASYLNQAVSELNLVSQRVAEALDVLQERRTALISAAVTGKIDVRDWKPPEGPADEQEVA